MGISNFRKIAMIKKLIKNFDGSDEQLKKISDLIYQTELSTKLSTKSRWGWSLSVLKNEINFSKFPNTLNQDDDYGTKNSLVSRIRTMQRKMEEWK